MINIRVKLIAVVISCAVAAAMLVIGVSNLISGNWIWGGIDLLLLALNARNAWVDATDIQESINDAIERSKATTDVLVYSDSDR